MSYRDRTIQCPRCGLDLTRSDTRDRWRCTKCKGALFAVADLVHELVQTAPDLVPSPRGSLTTLARRTVAPQLACSVCAGPMEPVFLGGVEVDRCYHDEVIWFDRGEVVDIARAPPSKREQSWLVRLLAFWFIG